MIHTKFEHNSTNICLFQQNISELHAKERHHPINQDSCNQWQESSPAAEKKRRKICAVVKAEGPGSAKALARPLTDLKLENKEVEVVIKVLISEAGDVTKSDIVVASVTPDTTVIAFNIGANAAAMDDARMFGVPIEYYSVV